MKRLALLLGSLLVVSAAASAKEVVPAPVVVEEAPVQIVEKEVIVYRDKEEGFRPNGYVDLQYRWYGDTEGQNFEQGAAKDDKGAATGLVPDAWNGANNYSRLQLQGKINMTEKQALEFRIRDFNDLDKETERNNGATGTQTRLRYFYDHGVLGDSKVDFTSRVHYADNTDNSQEVEYQARFNFAEYLFNNDFIKTTDFTLAPNYMYSWNPDNSSEYDNIVGLELNSFYELPWGFSAEFNVYNKYHFLGKGSEITVKDGDRVSKEDKNFTVDVEAYIYHTLPLYQNGKFSVTLNNEGGYDAYKWSQEKKYTEASLAGPASEAEHVNYSVYFLSTIGVDYQVTEFLNVYAAAGAEYRNWTIESEKSASNWRWQPTAWAGFKTTF